MYFSRKLKWAKGTNYVRNVHVILTVKQIIRLICTFYETDVTVKNNHEI